MSRYYCTNCERFINEEDIDTRQECMGSFWGSPAYETFAICPHCGSDEVINEEDMEEENEEDN